VSGLEQTIAGAFDDFWKLVIRKEPSKSKAYEAFVKALNRGAKYSDIMVGLERWLPMWRALDDPTKIPYITTWLNQERWTVEKPAMPAGPNGTKPEERRPSVPRFESIMHRYGKEGS
jgi:hypothetical protein